jgi:cellobiose phosphorylase
VPRLKTLKSGYGFYEALDFTPERVSGENAFMLVKAYMAHHQGMGLCALDNAINGNIMQQRFASIPRVRAYELLLEEHKPQHSVMIREFDEALPKVRLPKFNELNASRTVPARTEFPEAQMLSNGGYSIMLTNTGSGFSRSADTMLNRWRADHIRGEYGIFFGVYDKLSGELLSPTLAPFYGDATRHTVLFDSDKAVFTSHSDALEIKLEVCVPPEYRAEVRRLTLHNISAAAREVDITAYFEVCMAQLHDDIAHPAFNKLFIDAQEQEDILLFSRRERRSHEKNYMYAAYAEDGKLVHASWCSDRMLFPGRTSTLKQAFMRPLPIAPISLPIDPVMCMRSSLTLEAGQSISISLVIGMAQNIEEAMQHANELCADIPRAFDLAWTHAQVELRYTQLQPRQAVLAQRLVSHLLFDSPLRSRADIGANKLERCALWRFGLSGDRPMLLMDVKRESQLETVELLSTLHDYLKMKGLLFDLVFISTSDTGYFRPVYEKMQALSHHGVYLIDGDTISEDERTLLSAKASLVCSDGDILSDMLNIEPRKHKKNLFAPAPQLGEFVLEMPATEFFNGIGGFSLDGSEYIMRITKDTRPPLPWSNVMANDVFGTLVTESGAGYTWSGNSRDMKLTPWYNDTLDPKGEALLLRDERSGKTWTVTPGALNGGETIVRHGFGYSSFETGIEELESKLTVFVDAEKPLKYYFLQLKNPMQRERELSVTLAVEWVLGDSPLSRTDVVTAGQGAALTAYNCMHNDGKVAYIMPLERECEMTSSREEIWRYMQDGELEGALGGGLGGAGAVRVKLRLAAGEYQNIAFVLGHTKPDAINFSMKAAEVAMALDNVQLMWRERLGGLKVKTPERSFDLMINGWLLYQMWSARLLGRTGFYQAGGAYGFRDQLQDVLTIMATHPQRVRMLIKEFAAHQFERGDVQHWWHPPARGVRTYVSDDRLFLPYAVTEYIRVTGSGDILDERACYLADEPIPQGRDDLYCEIPPACADGDIYEHCVRAIDVSLEFGAHGLPLMGGGDWNDGMDTIGRGGGESVWLAWFIIEVLRRFIPVCHMRGDETRAKKYEAQAEALLKNAEEHGWDGEWYRRAYFAVGYPLGSAQNEECMIDCVSQAWAAIVGAQRAREAMDALEKMLLSEQDGILRLLMPPFDKTERRVGYIQGYVPGIRENGGQYTHGAIWAIIAFAVLGEKDRALKLFQLMNPIHHAQSRMQVSRYMGEPYVIAADVYGAGHRTGRAGWTWYTGSASWMYRAGVEWLLGIRRRGDKLEFEPCVPWSDFEAEYQFGKTLYRLKFVRGQEKSVQIELVDDGRTHDVTVVF